MIFYYSKQRLFKLFLFRFLPSIPFLLVALYFGEVFWVGVIVLWLEAVIEVYLTHKKGYFTLNEGQIKTLGLLFSKKLEIKEVNTTYVYNNEWTFQSSEQEIRLNKSWVRQDQRKEVEKRLIEFRQIVNQS